VFSPSANGGVRDISWKNNDKAAISDIYFAFQRIVNPVRGTLCEITTIWPLTNHINAKKRHSLRRVRLVKTPSAAIWMIVANTKQGRMPIFGHTWQIFLTIALCYGLQKPASSGKK
jgi:hypothetical protein